MFDRVSLKIIPILCLFLTMNILGCTHLSDSEKGRYSLRSYRDLAHELQDVILATEILPMTRYSNELNERIVYLSFELIDISKGISRRFLVKNAECKNTDSRQMKCVEVRELQDRPATIIATLQKPIDRESFGRLRHEVQQAIDLTEKIRL